MLVILANLYDLGRVEGAPDRTQAFTAQAYKAAVEALNNNGDWSLAWPLIGLPDPDDRVRQVTMPAERVALVALAKERKLLKEAMTPPPKNPPKGEEKGGKGGAVKAGTKKEEE